MTNARVRAALGCSLVVALAACGSSAKETAATTTTSPTTTANVATTTTAVAVADLDACQLVTKAKAEAMMGTKLQEGVPVNNSDGTTCTYSGDPSGPTAQVEVYVGDGAKKFYDDDNDVLHHPFTDVPDIGDEAHQEEYTLFFRKGTIWVVLHLVSLDDTSTFTERLQTLAKDVAAQM